MSTSRSFLAFSLLNLQLQANTMAIHNIARAAHLVRGLLFATLISGNAANPAPVLGPWAACPTVIITTIATESTQFLTVTSESTITVTSLRTIFPSIIRRFQGPYNTTTTEAPLVTTTEYITSEVTPTPTLSPTLNSNGSLQVPSDCPPATSFATETSLTTHYTTGVILITVTSLVDVFVPPPTFNPNPAPVLPTSSSSSMPPAMSSGPPLVTKPGLFNPSGTQSPTSTKPIELSPSPPETVPSSDFAAAPAVPSVPTFNPGPAPVSATKSATSVAQLPQDTS